MRIAFDLDGVLAELHAPFVQEALAMYPDLDRGALGPGSVGASPSDETAAAPPAAPAGGPSPEQSEAVWRSLAARENFWETLRECEPGIVRRIAELSEARRWEILFITSRPTSAGHTVQRQTQRWLRAHGFDLPSVYVVHGSRGQIASALQLDAVVDDRPNNCLDVVLESRAAAILVWRGAAATVPASARRLGIATTASVGDCLDVLVQAEEASTDGTGLLDRLRRLFGLRTRSAASILREQRPTGAR